MKKRLIFILITFLLLVSFIGCSSSNSNRDEEYARTYLNWICEDFNLSKVPDESIPEGLNKDCVYYSNFNSQIYLVSVLNSTSNSEIITNVIELKDINGICCYYKKGKFTSTPSFIIE